IIILVVIRKAYLDNQHEQYINMRTETVSHMIENINLYEDALKEWGYNCKICYRQGDIYDLDKENNELDLDFEKKIGYNERGIIQLVKHNAVYQFDRGLNKIFVDLGNNVQFSISLAVDDLPLSFNNKRHSFAVILDAPEYSEKGIPYSPFNSYNMDFTDFRIVWDGEEVDDKRIKKYISAEELQAILKKGLELEQKLVDMYNSHN
ncbi:MAG: hypothetical protein RSF81_08365, partial [Oscillospiraceae bacterium]